MKISHSIFISVYSLILLGSIIFGVNLVFNKGVRPDDFTELLLAAGYLLGLIFSIFLHVRSLKRLANVEQKLFLGVSYLNLAVFVVGIFMSLTCRDAGCMVVFIPMLIVISLWLFSFLAGIIALKR
ncbi:MAG: hypothetical protein AAB381_01675 [Patescibacteria group bacterium]